MIRRPTHFQPGFTAVELLITLFVAAAFLLAGYQLFNVVIKDGGDTRAQSQAANTAYDYMRRYSDSATNPCTPSNPLTNSAITVTNLSFVTISVSITCPEDDAPTLSKIDSIISYNDPQQTLHYATFVDKSKGATPNTDIVNGLVARWTLNGNSNTDVGNANATNYGATNDVNKYGVANMSYNFQAPGVHQYLQAPSTFGLSNNNLSMTLWVYLPSGTSAGQFMKVGDNPNGFGLGIGASTYDDGSPGTYLVGLFEGVRWINTSNALGAGWHFIAMTIDSGGTPYIYKDGALVGSYAGAVGLAPTGSTYIGGASNGTNGRWTTSSIDDVRVYNRTLSASEITQLNTQGPL